jgi:hypothetical protein
MGESVPKGAPYRPVPFGLSEPPPNARNAFVADFLSHLPHAILSEPLEGAVAVAELSHSFGKRSRLVPVLSKSSLIARLRSRLGR